MRYAAETTVPVERSRAEIEHTLARYGATRFAYATEQHRAQIVFEVNNRRVRFIVPLPDRDSRDFTIGRYGKVRKPEETFKRWEQACRQRWRALALAIKAKLEVVEAGISTFESEFLAHVVLPSGETVGEWFAPQLEATYTSGRMPPLLLEGRRE